MYVLLYEMIKLQYCVNFATISYLSKIMNIFCTWKWSGYSNYYILFCYKHFSFSIHTIGTVGVGVRYGNKPNIW